MPDGCVAMSNSMRTIFINILLLFCICSLSAGGEVASPPQRIVSLAPSTTEILFALGLGDRIVGVTSFCDHPEEAKRKPKIGGMSNPSLEAVVALKPDIVVMTTDGNPKEFEELLHSLHIRTYVFRARRIAELPQGIREMGAALNARGRAEALAGGIEKALTRFGSVHENRTGRNEKVLYIVWPEPLIVAGPGTEIDDAIALLGRTNVAASASADYPKYSLEEVLRQAPDVILIGKASGMDMVEVSRGMLARMTSVPAVRNGRVCYLGDGLYRLGPRIIQGIEELAECLDRRSQR
jgi:iron complex transport system substrate-binding protein